MKNNDHRHRLTAALLTPVGRGAVATIRIQGDVDELTRHLLPLFHAANGRALSQQATGSIIFGRWGADQSAAEDVVACRISADAVEIHCHGGDVATRRILTDLDRAGCPTQGWSEQLANSSGLLEAECAEMLSRATTWRTAEILHEQASGQLRHAAERLLTLITETESNGQALLELDEILTWSRFGQHLSQPWTVVLTGRPNVGKSSLINALLGYERAIVFDQPGTTRDVVTAETAFDGWPVVLADTAGLRDATEELEAAGIALAQDRLEHADARLVLIDLSQPSTQEDLELIGRWPDAIVIGHKCDLPSQWQGQLPASAIRVSSVTGQGLAAIPLRLLEQLIPRVPSPGTAIPITSRQVSLLQNARSGLAVGDQVAASREIERLIGETSSGV